MNREIEKKADAVITAVLAKDKTAFEAAVAEYDNCGTSLSAAKKDIDKAAEDFTASTELLSLLIAKSGIRDLADTTTQPPAPAPATKPEQAKPISGRVAGKRPRVKIPTAADKSS